MLSLFKFLALATGLIFSQPSQSTESDISFASSIYKNAEIKIMCATQRPSANCPVQKLSQNIQLEIIACKAVTSSAFCQEMIKKEPEFSQSLKRCRPDQFCEDYLYKELSSLRSCKDGFLEGSGETISSIWGMLEKSKDLTVDFFDRWHERAKKNAEARDLFRKICDKDLACKRNLVKDIPKFQNLSDASLDKYSTAILMLERENFSYHRSTIARQSVITKSIGERAEEAESKAQDRPVSPASDASAIQAIREWLKYKGARLDCLDAATQAELICWAASYIIDPLLVYSGSIKFARSAKYITDLITKNALKKQAIEAVEFSAVAEQRDQAIKYFQESDLIGRRLATIEMQNLPSSLRLAKYISDEGREYVAVEQAVRTPTGKIKTSVRELPIDPLTGAIDSKTPVGKMFLESIMKEREGKLTLAFFDVNNLGYINKNFAKGLEAGNEFIKSVAASINQVTSGKAQLFRNGGDEFVLLIHETDPAKIKDILNQIYSTVNNKELNKTFREEKIVRAQEFKANQKIDGAMPGAIYDQIEFARYSRAGVSAGSTHVGVGESLESVLARAEEQAKQAKIEIKEQMTIDTTKYGGRKPEPGARANQSFVPMARDPVSAPRGWSAQARAPDLANSTGMLTEIRQREVYRFGDTTIAQYENELGETILRQETYTSSAAGTRATSSREIIMNQSTGMIEGTTQQGRQILGHFVDSSSALKLKSLLRVDISSLGKINYFQNGTQAGDEIIRATSEVLKRECAQSSVPFKMSGGEFIVGLNQMTSVERIALQNRIRSQLANNPAIKKIFDQQREYLRTQMIALPANSPRLAELAEAQSKLDQLAGNFSVSNAVVEPVDSAEAILSRLRN